AGGGDGVVARARNHLGGGRAQHQAVGQVVGQVEARQHIAIAAVEGADLERLGSPDAVGEPPVPLAAAIRVDRRTAGRGGPLLAGQRVAVGTVIEVVVVGGDPVRGIGMLLGARDAHADIAAQAFGAEIGLQVGRVDPLVDVVDEVVLLAGLHRTV